MPDLAQVGLEFSTAGLKAGETAALSSFDRVEQGALKTQATVGATGKVLQDVAQKATQAAAQQNRVTQDAVGWYEKEAAAIRAKSNVMLSEVETYRRVMAARRDSIALADRERAETVAFVQDLKRKEEAAAAAAVPVAGVGKAAAGTAPGLRTMSTGLANLAAQEIGLRSGLGSLLGAVGNFGFGALTSLGIFAGLAAIALVWDELTSKSRALEAAVADATKAIDAQSRAGHGGSATAALIGGATDAARAKAGGGVGEVTAELYAVKQFIMLRGAMTSEEAKEEIQLKRTADMLKLEAQARYASIQATKEHLTVLTGLLGSLGGLITARLADRESVVLAQRLLGDLNAKIAAGIPIIGDHIAALQARKAIEEALKQPLYDRLALEAVDFQQTKAMTEARDRLNAVLTLGVGGLAQEQLAQAETAKVVAAAQERWALYTKTLADTTLGHLTVERAAAKGNATAKEYLATTRAQIEALNALNAKTSVLASLNLDQVGVVKIQDKAVRDYIANIPLIGQRLKVEFAKIINAPIPYAKGAALLGFIPENIEVIKARLDRIREHTAETARGMNGLFNDAFKDFFARGLKDWEAFLFSVQQLAGNVAGLIAKDIAFKMKEGLKVSGLERALGGVATAVGVAGPFVSAITGHGAEQREKARQAEEALKGFNLALGDFVAIARPRGVLGDALVSLTKQFEDLATQAAAAAGVRSSGGSALGFTSEEIARRLAATQKTIDANQGTYDFQRRRNAEVEREYLNNLLALRKAFDDNIEATKRRIALERQQLSEDLTVRALRAQGLTAEADAAAFQLQQQREFQAAVEKYGASQTEAEKAANFAILAQLGYTQGLEREAFLKAQAAEAQRKLNEQLSIGLSLDEQLFTAKGDLAGAAKARRDQGIFDTGLKLQSGALSPENAQKTFDLIWLNFNNTMQEIADAAEAATLALFNYNKAQREDYAIRLLVAQGKDAEAEARRFELAQRREYEQAVKDGADTITLAMLQQVQAAEAVAYATKKAADEMKRLTDALEAEARATENLTVRSLRATGKGAAADEASMLFQQTDEYRKAAEAGRSQAFLDQLKVVQKQERDAADQARRDAQQRTFDDAFPTTTAQTVATQATRVDLAVGLSETTGSRMAGLLASNNAYLSALPRIEAMLGAALSGKEFAAVLDETMAQNTAAANGAAGVLPGNR